VEIGGNVQGLRRRGPLPDPAQIAITFPQNLRNESLQAADVDWLSTFVDKPLKRWQKRRQLGAAQTLVLFCPPL